MITSVMDDVRTVLIGGHILVVATVMWMQRSMLEAKTQRINSDRGIVQSVIDLHIEDASSIPLPSTAEDVVEQDTEVQIEDGARKEDDSIGDPVDWNQTPKALGDETQWDNDIELLD